MKGIKTCFVLIMMASILGSSFVSAQSLQLGMTWTGDSSMAHRIDEAFREKLAELAPDANIEFQNVADIDGYDMLAQIIARFEREKDGIIVLRSNGAQWLGEHPPSIPTFIGAANNPVMLGVVKDMKAPEGNVTGVTYYLPLDTQFEIFQAIIPNLEAVFLLLEQGHASTAVDRAATQEVCQKLNIQYHEKACMTKAECLTAVKENAGKVSAFIIGGNALNIDNAENIVAAAGTTPVLSTTVKPVRSGALGGFVADDRVLGHMLAESVVDVLVNSKAIKDVPIKMDPNPEFFCQRENR